MGQRGPKPKPAHLHVVNGNPSKKPLAALADGTRVPVEIPEPPDFLDPDALEEWKRISIELAKLSLIAKIDRAALAAYCINYSRWRQCEIKIQSLEDDKGLVDVTSTGYKQMSVWLQISNRAVDEMKKFLLEFGMTPSARNRVTITPQMDMFGDGSDEGEEKESADPSEKYF